MEIKVKKRAPRRTMSYHDRVKQKQIGKLFMVDLAGCEDNRLTGNTISNGRIDESKLINSTYLSLVKVFDALRRGVRSGVKDLKSYCRDDKLTRLLRVALEQSSGMGDGRGKAIGFESMPVLVMIT